MTEDRKSIIIKEIKYWKASHLLPSHYCDFLLALYTEGESTVVTEEPDSERINLVSVGIMALNLFLLPISFFILYFTHLDVWMQVLFSFFIVTVAFVFYTVSKKKLQLYIAYAFIIFLSIILLTSVTLIYLSFGSILLTTLFAGFQCAIWILIGMRSKRKFLIFLGSTGIVMSFLFYVF
ncbi:hypothetical protein [Paraliobacillus sp. X-1268]|uniref:hypothetical protein n=1 Tax=Paraliobacillus sp. X-1268 TaxID=2213193 RepID=UPI000E3E9F29|nr:hypothetical protein [Paraliobacillus sp. X-1268]